MRDNLFRKPGCLKLKNRRRREGLVSERSRLFPLMLTFRDATGTREVSGPDENVLFDSREEATEKQ
jgi:hypothetical protein